MTDTGQALLATILAKPDDDGVRLIYADYLEEVGQGERAEFIRVQCRIAATEKIIPTLRRMRERVHHCVGDCVWVCGAVRRERELLCSNFDSWHNLPRDDHGRVWDMINFDDDPEPERQLGALFRRGFVDEMLMPWRLWADRHTAICAVQPVQTVLLPWGGLEKPIRLRIYKTYIIMLSH
jgi:uncharacterized protein (TIGR02996 family)